MGFAGSKTEAVFLLSVAFALNLVIFYGLITKPVIEYNLSTPLGYNRTIDFDSEGLFVTLETRNMGSSPARISLVAWSYNCTLRDPEGAQISVEEGFTEYRIPLDEPIRRLDDGEYTFTLEPDGNFTYLLFIFSVQGQPRHDPVTGFHNSFATFKPVRPTALLLKRVDGAKFMRVRSR